MFWHFISESIIDFKKCECNDKKNIKIVFFLLPRFKIGTITKQKEIALHESVNGQLQGF